MHFVFPLKTCHAAWLGARRDRVRRRASEAAAQRLQPARLWAVATGREYELTARVRFRNGSRCGTSRAFLQVVGQRRKGTGRHACPRT